MKRDEIQAALRADPNAVFAVRPGPNNAGPVHVRGLQAHPSLIERWTYAEYRQPQHPDPALRDWQPSRQRSNNIMSRELVAVEAVEQVFAERAEVMRSALLDSQNTGRVVGQLRELGVAATQIRKHIVVQDVDALGRLLDRLASDAK